VVVTTDGLGTGAPRDEVLDGVRVRRLTGYWDAVHAPGKLPWEQMYFALLPEIQAVVEQSGPPDVVLANSHEAALLAVMVAHQWPGCHVVSTYHQQDRERSAIGVGRSRLVYGLLPLSAFLVGSDYYRRKALAFGAPAERIHHIPHGVDTVRFTGTVRRRHGERLRLLLAGRIAPRKQQLFMVEVLQRVRAAGVDAHLVLAGQVHSSAQEYADRVQEAIARLGLSGHVELRSDVRHDEMPALYAAADLVVQPSTEEGLGLAVLEAMAGGVPVAVSDTVGLEEIIVSPELGLKLPVGDAGCWAQEITALYKDEDRRLRLAAAGQEHVRRAFSERTMLDATERALLDLCTTVPPVHWPAP
jgi:glycosyltransferase involved in cell wall biosynthesis